MPPVKVLYKFNREDKFDCLARPSQTYAVQTIPIDQSTTIGVIDLRICIQAVVDCSPELPGQDCDYTIYAHDYSEPDTPLVGQGSLSMALGSLQGDMGGDPKMVTGLVTRSKLGLLMGKSGETLEVKLKFSETQRSFRPQPQPLQAPQLQQQQSGQYSQPPHELHRQDSFSQQRPFDRSLTPTGTNEWNSFIQQNPQLGQQTTFSRGASPALSQSQQQPTHSRSNSFIQHPIPQAVTQQDPSRTAPTPVEPASETGAQGQASRPSSRASNRGGPRKKAPTGRPRGRPRKKPVQGGNTGNTSGYEDGTEGEDGPIRKRAKVTQVDTINNNPFGSEPDSLRVAASTSGSLRNFRPVGLTPDGPAGNHLQEVPRAPTPVPKGPFRGGGPNKRKRQSAMSREVPQTSPQPQNTGPPSPSQPDGRSPESIMAQTPAYSEGSPAEIGSSPPVPRTTSFMQSSPPPSSPMLPPMPVDQAPPTDALEHEEMTDLFGDEPSQATAAAKAAPAPYNGVRKSKKPLPRPADISTPMQVWRMEDCPDGTQELAHVHSYNQPDPTEPPKAQFRPLAPLRAASGQYRGPTMVPTPPATTDATEKPTSPPESDPPQSRSGLPEPGPPSFPFERPVNPPAEKPASPSAGEKQPVLQPAPEAGPTGLNYPQSYFAPFHQGAPAASEPFLESAMVQASGTQVHAQTSSTDAMSVPDFQSVEAQSEALTTAAAKKKAPSKPRSRAKAPPKPRKLARSQSAGNLATVPASEPTGPSGLSQSFVAEPEPPVADPPVNLRRAQSTGPLNIPVPASDPVGHSSGLAFPQTARPNLVQPTIEPPSDAIIEPSSPKSSKNYVKRNAIKQRLEAAIKRGEMPPYCLNCGAIETPTWRKIFCQDHDGPAPKVPEELLGSKPGMITTVQVLTKCTDQEPGRYRIVKKTLALDNESVDDWQERLLCNPCGIWLCKTFSYRPEHFWGGDAERLGKTRKRKASELGSKPKRSRSKSTTQAAPTSEAIIPPTDGLAPTEAASHEDEDSAIIMEPENTTKATPLDIVNDENTQAAEEQRPGSTHSSGSGSAKSPIEVELDSAMGTTKRLLFPSPRKDNSPKALSDLDVNIVQTSDFRRQENNTPTATEKGTLAPTGEKADKAGNDLEDLFRSSPPRPCTPPSANKAGPPTTPFKTPTRASPSHRPITRSVSRSLRSKGSILDSPSAAFKRTPSRTPSRTPRDEYALPGSTLRRPSPRHQILVDIDERLFDTPMSRAMNQMLSEPNFGIEDDEMDLVPSGSANWDTFNIFSTDGPLPSSPPRMARFDDAWEAQPKEWREFLSDIQHVDNEANEERE